MPGGEEMNVEMLAHFLGGLGRNSFQAGVLVLAVLLIQFASGKWLDPRWRCALWLLVVVRLLVPFSVSSAASMFNIWPHAMQWASPVILQARGPLQIPSVSVRPAGATTDGIDPQGKQGNPLPTIKPQGAGVSPKTLPRPHPLPVPGPAATASAPTAPNSISPRKTDPLAGTPLKPFSPSHVAPEPSPETAPAPAVHVETTPAATEPGTLSPAQITAPLAPAAPSFRPGNLIKGDFYGLPSWRICLFWIWLTGALALLLHILFSSLKLARRCARLRPLNDPATLAVLEECCELMGMPQSGVSGPLMIAESVEVSSPALHGLLRPRLLLPKGFAGQFSAAELKFVFLHELAHLKRRDLWMNWVMAFLQAVHWFNPLIWMAFSRWRNDRELACDAMVLEAAGAEHNQEYGETILRLLENFTPPLRTPGLVGILEDRRHLRERIGMIAAYVPAPRWSLLATVLLAALAVVGLTDARSDNPASSTPASVAAAQTDSQLTIELRDGSRLVGRILDDPLQFHSADLGDLKLPVSGIKSIEFKNNGTGDSSDARLTSTNGDVLDVQLVAPMLQVQTGFGKSEVPVKMIRSIKVSSAGKSGLSPSGLVALWSGNGNGNDSVGTNNAIVPAGVTYAPAKVGEGFQFNGNVGGLSIPPSPDLNIGLSSGFTLACWTAPTSATIQDPLMEWGGNGLANGVHLWISAYSGGIGGPGCIFANIVDTANQSHIFSSPPGIIQAGVLQHVALTYDKESGIAKMYYNGSLVASQNFGSFTPMTDKGLLIGERNERDEIHYQGILNEVSIFSRALTAEEIQAMYSGQDGGMSLTTRLPSVKPSPPTTGISTNEAGSQITLEIRDGSSVIGKCLDDPLKFHSPSLGDFKLPVVGIRSIEFNDKGDGGVARLTSTNGDVLDVQLVAPTLQVQTGFGKSEVPVKMIRSLKVKGGNSSGDLTEGLVALWSGDGEGVDRVGHHNGTFPYGAAFAPGRDGKAFDFDGSRRRLSVPDSPDFKLTNALTLSAWVYPRQYGGFIFFRGDNRPGLDTWTLDTYQAGFVNFTIDDAANQTVSTRAPLQLNQWQLVTATWDHESGDMKLYVNGELGSETNTPLIPIADLDPAQEAGVGIGNHGGTFHQFPFNGLIDDVGLYNRALSAGEIQSIYAAKPSIDATSSPSVPLPGGKSAIPTTATSTKQPGTELTLKLRDGSSVVGKILDDPLHVHSPTVGELKLPVAGIKSLEFTGDGGEARLTGTNGDVLDVKFDAPSLHVETGFGKSELPVKMIRSIKASSTGMAEQSSGRLINVDFGSGGGRGYSQKTGFAAIGQTPDDFWNFYDRDLSPAPNNWRRSGSLQNLKLANGETTAAGMSVSDAPGAWNDDSGDPMYRTYDYPLDGGNDIVTFTGLPAGQYEVLAYSPDGNYELTAGGTIKTIQESPDISEEKSVHQSGFRQNGLRLDSLDMPMLRDEWADSSGPFFGNHISSSEPAKLTAFDEITGFGPGKSLDWTFSTADRRAMIPRIASGNSEIIVGGTSYGLRTTRDEPVGSVPVWTEGVQYARWQNVTVRAGEPLYLTVRNGKGGWAILSGVQILSSGPAGQEQTPDADFVPKYDISGCWSDSPFDTSDYASDYRIGKHVIFTYNNSTYEHHFEGNYVDDHTVVGIQTRRKRSDGTTTRMQLTITLASPDLANIQWTALDSNSDLTQGQTGSVVSRRVSELSPGQIQLASPPPGESTDAVTPTKPVSGSTNGAASQTMFELRDGSHLAGRILDDPLHFHSPTVGDLKLTVKDIRSIDFEDGKNNAARLKGTNGDVLDVQFAAPTLHVETGFGKSDLPVKQIRRITITSSGKPEQLPSDFPPGLVALWSGDGNGDDRVGTNNAIVPEGVGYSPAQVGGGFSLDGLPHRILVPNAPELNFGAGQNFSITGWIEPLPPPPFPSGDVVSFVDKRDAPSNYQCKGYEFNLFQGRIHCRLSDSLNGNGGDWGPAGPDLRDGRFHFVALSVERNSTEGGKMYVDGQLVMTFDPTGVSGDLSTDQPLRIGNHPLDPQSQAFFHGIISEVALFNRALTASEIQSMEHSGVDGTEHISTPERKIPIGDLESRDL